MKPGLGLAPIVCLDIRGVAASNAVSQTGMFKLTIGIKAWMR